MRMRSTGLGRTELVGNLDGVAQNGDYLVLSIRTTAPVRWHVRTALSRKDVVEMLKFILKPRILLYFLSSVRKRDEGEAPSDY